MDRCIEWQGGLRSGYGWRHEGRRGRLVHRWIWELAHGPIPAGILVLHSCDNPKCYRLSHLWLGTHHDNVRDCMAKGRFRCVPPKPRGPRYWHRLNATPRKVIPVDTIEEMRRLRAQGMRINELACRFGLNRVTVRRKLRGYR